MNYKQKLGYTLLGAAVMAVGIIIGQLSTPNIEAQSNGVFDKIVCKKITVVDADGNPGILLESSKDGYGITINHKQGKEAISLIAASGVAVIQLKKPSGESAATLMSMGPATMLSLGDEGEKAAISLSVLGDIGRSIAINDRKGTEMIELNYTIAGTNITISDEGGEPVWSAP